MYEGRNSFAQQPKNGRGIPRAIARLDVPPHKTSTAPRTIAAGQTGAAESPPCTIAASVAESTLDSEWVRRAPHAALILPPPPQFADSLPLSCLKSRFIPRLALTPHTVGPTQVSTLPYHSPTPRVASAPPSPPSRSHTSAPVIQLSHSHALQSCELVSRPQGPSKPQTSTPPRHDVRSTLYAAAATPAPGATHCSARTTAPCHLPSSSSNADVPHFPPRSAYPPLVAERFPNWTRHFRAIAGALGHAPNARPLRRGVIFLPETAEEFRVVRRCLTEAAAQDNAISWRYYGPATKKHVKVAIRGLPLETPATQVVEALCALGYPAEAARAIPAPHGRPSCTYCVRLAHQTKDELRYLYQTTELLNMPNVSVVEWRERSRPSRFLRSPARTPDRHSRQERRANTPAQSPAPHTAVRQGAARSSAAAVPCNYVPSSAATPAASSLSDAAATATNAQAEATRGPSTLMANSNDPTERGETLRDRRRRRRRAPRSARLESPNTVTSDRTLVDAPCATFPPPEQASPSTDLKNIVHLVVEALTTVMAAYLREKGAIQND